MTGINSLSWSCHSPSGGHHLAWGRWSLTGDLPSPMLVLSISQEKPLLFGPTSGNLPSPACSQSSSAHQVLSTKNNQTQATLLPRGLSNKSSFRQPPGRRCSEALTLSSCNIKSISVTSPLRHHLHQDKAAWLPENGTQQVRVRGEQVIPLGRGKLFYVEHSCVMTVPPLTLETRTPQTHQRRLETCPSSREMEPGCGPSFSVSKFRPPSLIITHSKLQGTGQCGGRAGQGEAVLMATRDILASGVLAPGTFQRVLLPHTPVLAAGWDGACLDMSVRWWVPHVPAAQRLSSEGASFSHSLPNVEAQGWVGGQGRYVAQIVLRGPQS